MVGWQMRDEIERTLDRVGRQRDTFGAADVECFLHGGLEDRADVGIVAQGPDRLPRQRRQAGIGWRAG